MPASWQILYSGVYNPTSPPPPVDISGIGIQSLAINYGRAQVQDPFQASTVTLTGRTPSALPANIAVGDLFACILKWNGTDAYQWSFVISDISIRYGLVSNEDTWTIQGEGSIAQFGRAAITQPGTIAAGTTTRAAAYTIASTGIGNGTNGYTIDWSAVSYPIDVASSTISALPYAVGDNLLDIVQKLARTEQAFIRDSTYGRIFWTSRDTLAVQAATVEFTDGTLGTALIAAPYETVEFRSRADSYSPSVIVEPDGLAAQRYGTDTRVFTLTSYDRTTTQARDLAAFVQGTLIASSAVPQTVTWLDLKQSADVYSGVIDVGKRVRVVLRGTRYECVVIGGSVVATETYTRASLNFAAASQYNYFQLDNSILGVLDKGRLGF